MRIDDYDFDMTAEAVYNMNPSARERYDSWEDLREFMVSMAYSYCHAQGSNSFSTSGFNLTAYDDNSGERVVRASVSSYVALEYYKRVKRLKELLRVL